MVSTGGAGVSGGIGDGESRRRYVEAVVLELLRTRGPASRPELSRLGGLKQPLVVEVVEGLIGRGLISEAGVGPSTGGRPPSLLELRPKARRAVGVNVGTRSLTAVVADLHGNVETRIKVPSEMSKGPEALVERVKGTLEQLLEEMPGSLGEVLGIGLALPAPTLSSRRPTFSPPSYPDWGESNLGEEVEEEFGLPVLMDNDANAAVTGEHLYGAGQGVGNLFYFIAHRGVGGAAIIEGSLYRGVRGGAGEIGHTVVDLEGPLCGCGRYGCLEAFVGRAAISRRASRAMKLAGRETINEKGPDQVKAEDVIEAGLTGDEMAREVLEETGRYLGLGVSNVANVFDPEVIIVGGSTMGGGDLILAPAIEVARSRALPEVAGGVRIVAGKLGEDAGAVGAAALVLRGVFSVSVTGDQEREEEDLAV